MKRHKLSILLLALVLSSVAGAGTVYDNGPAAGNTDAWTINFGYSIANSFVLPFLSDPYTLQGFSFMVWALPGDTVSSVDWAVTSAPFSGSIVSGTNTLTQTFLGSNIYGYDLNLETFSIPDFLIPAGTYYFQLQNAIATSADPVYWDQNDGPSQAFDSVMGNLASAGPGLGAPCSGNCTYSESFQVLGHAPEPTGFVLLGTGLLGVGVLLRRQRSH